MIVNSNMEESERIILPVPAFKQILGILGIKISDSVGYLQFYFIFVYLYNCKFVFAFLNISYFIFPLVYLGIV